MLACAASSVQRCSSARAPAACSVPGLAGVSGSRIVVARDHHAAEAAQAGRRRSLRAATAADAATQAAAADAEPAWFSVEMQARDYELDQFNVINNAVYANYLQHVRHEFLLHVGVSADTIARTGDALALSELHMRYIKPLRSGDHFRGTCRVSKATGVRLVFEQQIWRLPRKHRAAADSNGSGNGGSANAAEAAEAEQQEELVLTAEAVVVSLDKRYKPKRISAALRERLVSGTASEGPPIPLQELL
ncbi:long-chain acyl- thioesterase -like [Chlorella sorokiniana]|uniref:Long-chain acyl-thioesterase-like n=1 Tax=Chlorella sorokiniana TaxID=3076 RepID=A0A2P6TQC2_CHLSO|nr:long-chain acyl- thioesterase -like [Chlorella sorokiniana]|eukprot:PRW56227.1 long-chain acyl- thioesterase -like [Chlorella sorokiniana]